MYSFCDTDRHGLTERSDVANRNMLRRSVQNFTRQKQSWYIRKLQADGIHNPYARRAAQLKVDQERHELRESGRVLNSVISKFSVRTGVEVRAECRL